MQGSKSEMIEPGSFVELRGRPWLVEALRGDVTDLQTLSLSCISDDSQGERLEVLWDAEIGAAVLDEDGWRNVGQGLPDSPEVLAAHLRTIRWRSATAADRDLLQAPFRAGIRLDAYQLLPLRKALRLPRVNLLIADDVGLGNRISGLAGQKASMAKLAFVELQQRLLSSVAAFARTLKVHRTTLQRVLDGEEASLVAAAAQAFVEGPPARIEGKRSNEPSIRIRKPSRCGS
jgi:hypothetical protein